MAVTQINDTVRMTATGDVFPVAGQQPIGRHICQTILTGGKSGKTYTITDTGTGKVVDVFDFTSVSDPHASHEHTVSIYTGCNGITLTTDDTGTFSVLLTLGGC